MKNIQLKLAGFGVFCVIRVRQTAQENAPFISVSTSGYVLPGQPAISPAGTSRF